MNIPDDKQHRQVKLWVNSKKYYIIDGYDPINKIAYEFNGDIHHGNPDKYPPDMKHPKYGTSMDELYKNTRNKEKQLKKAGYKVISIWESEWKSIIKTVNLSKKESKKTRKKERGNKRQNK